MLSFLVLGATILVWSAVVAVAFLIVVFIVDVMFP